MGERRGPGDRQHDRGAVQQPCERDLPRCCVVTLGYPGHRRIGPGKATLGKRIERNENNPGGGANVDQAVGRAVPQIIAVLDRHDFRHALCPRQFVCRDVRHADTANFALTLKVNEGPDRILDRHTMIDGMELIEVDPLESQPPQTVRTSAAEMLRPAIDVPVARTRARQPALARYYELRWIRVEGL